MQDSLSLKSRHLLSFWIVLILALLLPAWTYYRSLTREVLAEAQKGTIHQLDLVHWMIGNEKNFQTLEELQQWLTSIGKQLRVRVTYVASDGRVLADSQIPFDRLPELESFSTRPEIVQARTQDVGLIVRTSRVTQQEEIFAARRIAQAGIVPGGIVRVAAPLSDIQGQLDRLKYSFFLLLGLIFAATSLMSFVLIRRLRSPIRTLIDATDAIGGRDYKCRLHFTPGQEFYPLAQSVNQMAERIDHHMQAVMAQKQQLEAVFNGMQEGVMVLNSRGKVQSINRALARIIGDIPQYIGKRPLEVIMSLELQGACDRVLSDSDGFKGTPYHLEILRGEHTYDVTLAQFQDWCGGTGAIVVFHDISELKRLEKVRQDFVANVSHELRTPLTSIKGYTETLLSDAAVNPETTSSFLQVILKNTNHMVKMVDDLLQLARLESRHKPLSPVPVDPNEALLAAWKACAPLAEAKALRLQNDLPEGLNVTAEFDQLVQVFRNLLENAIRHSPPSEAITATCRINVDRVTFGIRDEGPGIPKHHQQRIFERFYRLEKHRGTESGSTGLGLAICRHILRNHGGRIWVQSPNDDEAKGTTFHFTLFTAQKGEAVKR